MSMLEESLRQQLLADDPEFRRLHEEHQAHERRLEELAQQTLLSEEDELEEKQIKRKKLYLKDRMEAILRSRIESSVPV